MSNTASAPPQQPASASPVDTGRVTSGNETSDRDVAAAKAGTEVPVVTRLWCTIVMVSLASFMCLVQTAFTGSMFPTNSLGFYWFVFATLISLVSGFIMVARSQYPEPVFWVSCGLVLVFPFDPLIVLMSLTSLLARRRGRRVTLRAIAAATAVALYSQLRDVIRPAEHSLWHVFFADPATGQGSGTPLVMLTGEPVIVITAVAVSFISVALAVLLGLHIRSRAELKAANDTAHVARAHAGDLQHTLNSQQLADAIAVEAHDTLAHSLSLIATNANVMQVQTSALATNQAGTETEQLAEQIKGRAADIRQQAADALAEAHSVIDMLRHPEAAWAALAPGDDTALTQESLGAVILEARESGMQIDTWIDIRQLSQINESISTIAYRAVQEGLTNVRRHAPNNPVSLQVTASPESGIRVHLSNPTHAPTAARSSTAPTSATTPTSAIAAGSASKNTTSADTATRRRQGTGLAGLAARARSVGGTCHYGLDHHSVFHLDVLLPSTSQAR